MDNKRPQLALLSTSFPLSRNSSSGIFVARLTESLAADFSISVITPASSSYLSPAAWFHPHLAIVPFRYAPLKWQILAHTPGGIPLALKQHRWLYLLLPCFLISMFFNSAHYGSRCGIIHANWAICGAVAGLAGRLFGFPVLTTLRGEDVARAKKSWMDRAILTVCVTLSERIVGVSQGIVDQLLSSYPLAAGKFVMIPNGVDNELLAIDRPFPPNQPTPPPAIRLLSIGSLIPRKGMDVIIQALARIDIEQPFQLTIAGDGPEMDRLKGLAQQTGIADNVTFLGAIPPAEVVQLLSDTDIFILASHSEGRPNVVLEAMAAKLPVIASDIEGTRELVMNGHTGLLFQDGHIDQLCSHIQTLSRNATLRQDMGVNGRCWILDQNLRWRDTARQYGALYTTMRSGDVQCAA